MAHFRLRTGGAVPRDIEMGFRLRKLAHNEAEATPTGRAPREFGPPPVGEPGCEAEFEAWSITFRQNNVEVASGSIDFSQEWQAYIWPSSGSVLCEGDCLEWSYLGVTNCTGPEPDVSIAAGEDCVGLIVTIAGQESPPYDCSLSFAASLDGVQFGTDAGFVVTPAGPPPCEYEVSGDGGSVPADDPLYPSELTFYYPTASDWSIEIVFTAAFSGSFEWNAAMGSTAAGVSSSEDLDFLGRPRITVTHVYNTAGYPEDDSFTMQVQPRVNGVDIDGCDFRISYPTA